MVSYCLPVFIGGQSYCVWERLVNAVDNSLMNLSKPRLDIFLEDP